MYYLMNKDNIVLSFDYNSQEDKFNEIKNYSKTPIGFTNIKKWVSNRKASKHNNTLQRVMENLGCANTFGYMRITHAASINDTFWIKNEHEKICWNDVSLYTNEFSYVISKLAFEGVGLYDISFPTTTPELSSEGSYRKCFIKENTNGQFNSDIFIYKRGGEYGTGFETYSEVLSSEIAKIISPDNSVNYELAYLHDIVSSKCNLFTNEKYGFAPAYKLFPADSDFDDMFEYFEKLGSEQLFREMLLIDSMTFNQDRHRGNFGVMFDNDTLEIKKLSPCFDLNISLFAFSGNVSENNIGDILYEYRPKLSDSSEDFIRLGQSALNDKLRERLKDLRDFNFSFRGDDVFSPERVKSIEKIVNRQAKAVLSGDKLFIRDIFFSEKYAKHDNELAEQRELEAKAKEANKHLLNCLAIFEDSRTVGNTFVSIFQDKTKAELCFENYSYEAKFDFMSGSIDFYYNVRNTTIDDIKQSNSEFYEDIYAFAVQLKDYMHSNNFYEFEQSIKLILDDDPDNNTLDLTKRSRRRRK